MISMYTSDTADQQTCTRPTNQPIIKSSMIAKVGVSKRSELPGGIGS